MSEVLDDARKLELMREAIKEAARSRSEDHRVHPFVGAILSSPEGTILHRAHRGEILGAHAEFTLFEKARRAGTPLDNARLFVTLEPCTRRGPEKTPCALRVAAGRVRKVFIGTLDPNPHITGRGESFLAYQTEVERFPWELQLELRRLNTAFFQAYAHDHVPICSPYAAGGLFDLDYQPLLSGQREGLLQQSLDLITGSQGRVWMVSGRLGWLRELQLGILSARLSGREVIILCSVPPEDPQDFERLAWIAASLGATVIRSDTKFAVRGTLVDAATSDAAMIVVEKRPSLHGLYFKRPHDEGVIDAVERSFWFTAESGYRTEGRTPRLQSVDPSELIDVLRNSVSAYSGADITIADIRPADARPLTSRLERFKLFRLSQLEAIRSKHSLSEVEVIVGSPWPITPPVVEVMDDHVHVVVDGAHRVYSALSRGIERIRAVVVRGTSAPLPARPHPSWDAVQVETAKAPRSVRYREFDQRHFRPIRRAFEQLALRVSNMQAS